MAKCIESLIYHAAIDSLYTSIYIKIYLLVKSLNTNTAG